MFQYWWNLLLGTKSELQVRIMLFLWKDEWMKSNEVIVMYCNTIQLLKPYTTTYKIFLLLKKMVTISKALQVPSSIGNNWSLCFIEASIWFSTKTFCEKVGKGDRTLPTGSGSFWHFRHLELDPFGNMERTIRHPPAAPVSCSNLFIGICRLQMLNSISNQRNPSNCSFFPFLICSRWDHACKSSSSDKTKKNFQTSKYGICILLYRKM